MRITFHGAAGEVTGSCHLVETDRVRFLVDCGLFQGGREAAAKNLAAFPFDVRTIDFVVITHAHLDHSGLLPRLVALGYRNPVYCTSATADLLQIMLRDSAYIHEKEAAWANERRASTKRASPPIEPLYTIAQAEASFPLLSRAKYGVDVNPHPAVRVRFQDAGPSRRRSPAAGRHASTSRSTRRARANCCIRHAEWLPERAREEHRP